MGFHSHPPFKRRHGDTCTFSNEHFEYTYQKPRPFKRRKYRGHKPYLPAFEPPAEAFTQDESAVDMQTPASPKAPPTHDNFENDDDDTAKRHIIPADDTELVKPKRRSSLASNLAAMSLPLPEDFEELKSRFLHMCSTLLTYSEGRTELIKKNERLQAENDGLQADNEDLKQTLTNRNGFHKQQMQKAYDESDKLNHDLTAAQQRNDQLQKELKQSNVKHEQEMKALKEDCTKIQQQNSQLQSDLKAAKQQADINKNRYDLELKKQGELSKSIQTKNNDINERNRTIEALRKEMVAQQNKQLQVDDLTQTLAQTDGRLQQSLDHLRLALPLARNAQVDRSYAIHSLSSAHDESEEYAVANILALGQNSSRAAGVREQAMRSRIKELKGKLETSESDVARLKTEKTQVNEKLANATKLVETRTNAEKSSTLANAELAKLRDEQKEVKKKYEAARTELTTLTSRCEDLQGRLYQTKTAKDTLSNEKQDLTKRNGELQQQLSSAERQAKAHAAKLQSKLDLARKDAKDAAQRLDALRPPRLEYTRLDQVDTHEEKLPARMLDVYGEDKEQRVEIRVDGKILFRPFVVSEHRMEDTHHVLDGPLIETKTMPEAEILSNTPWALSIIEYNPTELENLAARNSYDLFKLPFMEGEDEDSAAFKVDVPVVEDDNATIPADIPEDQLPVQDLLRHPSIGAPPAPEFMLGANIIRTRDSISDDTPAQEDVQKKSPPALKGAGIQRIEIPKPQPEVSHSPTPASSVQASPKDSVLMTPRSPGEIEPRQPKPLKRLASQSTNNDPAMDPRSPKRQRHVPSEVIRDAPSDPVQHAPKQPRNYDPRFEYREDRSHRAPPPAAGHRRSGGAHREYDSYKPGSDPRRRDPRDTHHEYEREQERQRTEGCYQRRW
ncbi:hypothetical protein PRZ48_002640 [Zasmidium cellare]|uniref:Uncharacterized protein n=1 Tax=Zasmidium cellare TaxID=395010 RepID=A0ABR0ESS8_ZASCE|nr:hypothetical protein PRZ48_002640 [Zasmidium cellare]